MKLKRLPIGIQTFSEIIEENYLYIDKTKIALDLIKNYKYAFLSRPRRFGKSLFLSTLKEIFSANQKVFEGLYIYDKWDWSVKYPVIHISFSGDMRSSHDLKRTILAILRKNQEDLNLKCENVEEYDTCFEELIVKSYETYNQKVVILIDEYDKGILDNLDQLDIAYENREILRSFYSIMKESDQYIKFVFITGVSKFSRASIFSGLNMLEDITLSPRFGNICGYTQNDIESTLLPYLQGVDLEKLRVWYNGYNFLKDSVYNPFDILKFIKNDFLYDNYWFISGTPSFLIKLIKEQNYFLPKLGDIKVGKDLLDSFDIKNMNFETVLFQTGYLTIDRVEIDEDDEIEYFLKVPNREVQQSINNYIIAYLYNNDNIITKRKAIRKALKTADLEGFKKALVSIFASIPYNNYTNNDIYNFEGFYASIVYVYLASLGVRVIGEDVTNRGRIDLSISINNNLFVIEFKVGKANALNQIKSKNYHQKYLNDGKDIYLVGINFCQEDKNISGFEWERVN